MPKHHVNPNTGNAGVCKSAKGKCPFGTAEEHHDTPQAAQKAAEEFMEKQYKAINTAYRKKDNSGLEGMSRDIKKLIISQATEGSEKVHPSVVAKVLSTDEDELIRKNVSEKINSQKILREMASDESARVRLAVAKATNNPKVLASFLNDPDSKVQKAAIENKNIPIKARKAALEAIKQRKLDNFKKVTTS